jgi:hypothetical protein
MDPYKDISENMIHVFASEIEEEAYFLHLLNY